MQIDTKSKTDNGQFTGVFSEPYSPAQDSFRWVSVANLMSLKNILENYKYHTS